MDAIDLIELDEAFAPQVLAVVKAWGRSADNSWHERLNVNGSGISFGHPIGVSGARIRGPLAHELRHRDLTPGVHEMCIGSRRLLTVVFERAVHTKGHARVATADHQSILRSATAARII